MIEKSNTNVFSTYLDSELHQGIATFDNTEFTSSIPYCSGFVEYSKNIHDSKIDPFYFVGCLYPNEIVSAKPSPNLPDPITVMKYNDQTTSRLKVESEQPVTIQTFANSTILINSAQNTHINVTISSVSGTSNLENSRTFNGILPSSGKIIVDTNPPNEIILEINGAPSGSISGMKFIDENGNGIKDSGESGLGNWEIVLKKLDDMSIATITTASDGTYSFGSLPVGTYNLNEIQQSGWKQTAPGSGSYTITLAAGDDVTGKDFGNTQEHPIPEFPTLFIPVVSMIGLVLLIAGMKIKR
jgi:hypothetical protein